MGLFDRFKGHKNQLPNDPLDPKHIAELDRKYQEEIKGFITPTTNHTYRPVRPTPVMQTSRQRVDAARQEAIALSQEFKKKDFERTYKKISDFKSELELVKLDVLDDRLKSDAMKNYDKIRATGTLPQRNIDKLFLPYLVEKKAFGLLTRQEQDELNTIFGRSGKESDIKNATSKESYTTDYDTSLAMLGVLGLLETDGVGNILGFDSGKALRDMRCLTDFEINTYIQTLAHSAGITLNRGKDKQDDELSL